MIRLLRAFLVIAVLLGLCACGSIASENQYPSTQKPSSDDGQVGYGFVFLGVELVPGDAFAADDFPQPRYVYTQTNNALGGKDTFYNYTDIEITVYDDGKTTVIRRIVVIDPNLKTPEGLALGDALEQATKLYGNNYTQDQDVWLFHKGDTVIAVVTQDGYVAGIEYRFAENNQ